jgi:hypothetical protein
VVRAVPIATQRVPKHIPAATNTSVARQRRGKHAFATIVEAVFSAGPPPDYVSGTEPNQFRMSQSKNGNEN